MLADAGGPAVLAPGAFLLADAAALSERDPKPTETQIYFKFPTTAD